MSSSCHRRIHLEIGAFSGVLARAATRDERTVIEEITEMAFRAPGANRALLGAALSGFGSHPVLCTARPRTAGFHLASAEEARGLVAAGAIRDHLERGAFAAMHPWRMVLSRAGDRLMGGAGRSGRWLAAGAPESAVAEIRSWLLEPPIPAERIGSATLAFLAAARRILKVTGRSGGVVVLDLGSESSTLFLVNAEGVEAVEPVGIGLRHVVDAVAAEVEMKLPGTAERLFFNPRFDFSRPAAGIVGRLAPAWRAGLDAIVGRQSRRPSAFTCLGLPSGQDWFGRQLALALGLEPWRPDIRSWLEKAGLGLGEAVGGKPLAVEWIGVLGSIEGVREATAAAVPAWFDLVEPERADAPSGPAPAVRTGAAQPAASGSRTGRPGPPLPSPLQGGSSLIAAAAVKSARESAASGAPLPAAVPAAAKPPEGVASGRQATTGRRARRGLAGWVSMGALAAIVTICGYLYFQQVEREKAEARAAAALAARRAAVDAEALRAAEERALAEAEARREAEALAARQLAAAEAARLEAEEQARRREIEANRLVNARGTVRVRTEPEGAEVVLGSFARRPAPAEFQDLRLGRYAVSITLDGHEPVALELDVREEAVTDPGLIRLRPLAGNLDVTTHPAGVAFDLRPASGRLFVSSNDTHQGVTPAVVPNLPPGEFVLTLERAGWPRHSQTVTIEDRRTTTISHGFVGAAVRLTSVPAGAKVSVNGVSAGSTPVTLAEVPPGELVCVFELEGYRPVTLARGVEAEASVEVAAVLERVDRIARLSELDVLPEAINTVRPELASTPARTGRKVVVSCLLDLDGVPRELRVEEAPDADAGERCLNAVAQWRFKPGSIKGEPVRTRVNIPFMIR